MQLCFGVCSRKHSYQTRSNLPRIQYFDTKKALWEISDNSTYSIIRANSDVSPVTHVKYICCCSPRQEVLIAQHDSCMSKTMHEQYINTTDMQHMLHNLVWESLQRNYVQKGLHWEKAVAGLHITPLPCQSFFISIRNQICLIQDSVLATK